MDFSFISDEQFRTSLVDDYRELMKCRESGSWKAVHVLAGSIVEALLIEYLVVSNIQPNGKDPLTLALYDAVQACQSAGVIQKSTASLCDVIRDYRNLIHPGRLIRLQQQVNAEGASIAVSLVALITREVAAKRKATYWSYSRANRQENPHGPTLPRGSCTTTFRNESPRENPISA